ncbi:PCYT2 [Branchiostoma lanceolatum]|uniref:PCYT2 protein n=1 Tax=Branchiostoma lanceolatum TaxID=7740 RepID=A0A8K0AEI5_BRALA|nr:PCYT2 [Branchiostoma lanceolatum]
MPSTMGRVLDTLVWPFDAICFMLMHLYDVSMYKPIQTITAPVVRLIPRTLNIGGKKRVVFSANIVTWSRTILFIPIAVCLMIGQTTAAFWLVILHDYLDHVGGIVARVHRTMYGSFDEPILGGFMGAFYDQIVNCLALWGILLVTDYRGMTVLQSSVLITSCAVVILYEFTIGIVRAQDYLRAFYSREFGKVKRPGQKSLADNAKAAMEDKTKEKLASLGIAFLCLAQGAEVPMDHWGGAAGVVCLVLYIRLAHASLDRKPKARRLLEKDGRHDGKGGKLKRIESAPPGEMERIETSHNFNLRSTGSQATLKNDRSHDDHIQDNLELDPVNPVDTVFTVGCFDLFHTGHKNLLQRMRKMGRKLVVGVHDSASIYKNKRRMPIESTETRMRNVKVYADVVFCVASADPTDYIECIVDQKSGETAMYVRGDDWPSFPGMEAVGRLMPIRLLPYTPGVSSTILRKRLSVCAADAVEDNNRDMFY